MITAALCGLFAFVVLAVGAWLIEVCLAVVARRERAAARCPSCRRTRPRVPAPRWPIDGC